MPIKSFQGERAQKERITPSKLTVSDIMTHQLIVFKPEDTIHEVMEAFIKNKNAIKIPISVVGHHLDPQ